MGRYNGVEECDTNNSIVLGSVTTKCALCLLGGGLRYGLFVAKVGRRPLFVLAVFDVSRLVYRMIEVLSRGEVFK